MDSAESKPKKRITAKIDFMKRRQMEQRKIEQRQIEQRQMEQKDEGGLMGYVFPLMVFMMIALLITYAFRQKIIAYGRIQLEDALTDAVLAAAVVDLDLFGENEYRIENYDYGDLYQKFQTALSQGLGLDENGVPKSDSYLAGGITVEEFWIYNMERNADGKIVSETVCRYISGGRRCNLADQKMDVPEAEIPQYFTVTPNGKTVNSLTIYAKISTQLKGVWGSVYPVSKEQAADVTKN